MLEKSKYFFNRLFFYTKNILIKRQAKCIVLCYHKVCDLESDPLQLSVSKKNFEAHIKHLKEKYNIIRLQDLISHLQKREVPNNSIVITFDDGYADNLYNARPILEKYNAPATIFVTSGMVNSNREFWWDGLEHIFLSNKGFQNKYLAFNTPSIELKFTINNWIDAKNAYTQIHDHLLKMNSLERNELMNYLFDWAGISNEACPTHRIVTSDELRSICEGDLIEIGSHGITHSRLSSLNFNEQKREINESNEMLSDIIGGKIYNFSYPFGSHSDFSKATIKILADSEYTGALTNIQGNVYNDSSRYNIPRRIIRNWDLNIFQKHMDSLLNPNDIFDITGNILDQCTNYYRFKKDARGNIEKLRLSHQNKKSPDLSPVMDTILHINSLDYRGGAAGVSFGVHRRLKELGYHSKMLVSHSQQNDTDIDVIHKKISKKHTKLLHWQKENGFLDLVNDECMNIIHHAFYKKTSILHLHNLHGGYFSPLILPALTTAKPTVWTLHDMQAITGHCSHSFQCEKWITGCIKCPDLNITPALKKDKSSYLWQMKKQVYQQSNITIVCPSVWLRNKVSESILSDKDIRIIHNGINTETFRPMEKEKAREKLGLPPDKKILLFLSDHGTDNSWKGSDFLYSIYNKLKISKDVLFLCIGGEKSKQIDPSWIEVEYIKEKNLIANYYSASDIFVYPSTADNFPLAVIESLSCGTPVIAFNTGGIPEIVDHLNNGYIAKYSDVDDFINGVYLFLNNKEKLRIASKEAREKVLKNFSLESMVDSYLGLYNELHSDFIHPR